MSGFELLRSRLWKFLYRNIAVCLTVRRYLRIVSFETYGGAFRIRRKALDWRVCNLLIFDIFAAPHSSMP